MALEGFKRSDCTGLSLKNVKKWPSVVKLTKESQTGVFYSLETLKQKANTNNK